MSNVSYDLDTSGGLMPLIRALIKPPDEEVNAPKPKKPQHPYYKRPGKGHNHDSCDACGEGGDLICCDRCPASFHLGCYDPPLDEDDIPAGLWLCRECQASDDKAPSSRSSRAQSPADKSDAEKKTRSLRSRVNSKRSKSRDDEDKEPEKEPTPMEILVRAAKIMNPRQFELPSDMKIKFAFPGTEKDGTKNGTSSLVTVDAWGCVPLPAKSCYVCEGTCKSAPLLQCDYCPLLFHQDCLDPPLTALPTGRWMCPNHVEQYIDWKLVNSISATERVALWDKFSGPIDQHTIKLDFIRRAKNRAPCFREKIPEEERPRVAVPSMVKYHYSNPPPLLPSRREHVRCTNVLKRLKLDPKYDAADEEDDTLPKHQICMTLSCPQYSGGVCPHQSNTLKGASNDDANDDLNAISAKMEKTGDSSELSDSDCEHLTAAVKKRSPRRRRRLSLRAGADAASLLSAVDQQLGQLDQRLLKLLAWQRLQQVLVGERCYGPWKESALSGRAAAAVHASVDRGRLARLGFRPYTLPSQLLSSQDRAHIAATGTVASVDRGRLARLGFRPYTLPSQLLSSQDRAHIAATGTVASVDRGRLARLGFRPYTLPSQLLSSQDRAHIAATGTVASVDRGRLARLGFRPYTLPSQLLSSQDRAHIAATGTVASVDRGRLARLGFRPYTLPSQLLSSQDRAHIAATVFGEPKSSPPRADLKLCPAPHVPAKATLCELLRPTSSGLGDALGPPIAMRLSSLSVGTDSGCDVTLYKPGCRALSKRHAVIFLDEVTRHFELINYSEWGSLVNGVLYACDAAPERRAAPAEAAHAHTAHAHAADTADARGEPAAPDGAAARARAVRELVGSKAPLRPAEPAEGAAPCGCRAPLAAAWEGSALLPHGALLQFGCAVYVFSIADAAACPYEENERDPAI
ncbi:PHD finger protein 12 [Amyelois transitella]|uniref:PHD finger protein 12 n=1 Tax=Amyelois transitella TaxID=680683 RepID=UPI0029901788|nr:PHD finger protein 12 [Amyelois transitella]